MQVYIYYICNVLHKLFIHFNFYLKPVSSHAWTNFKSLQETLKIIKMNDITSLHQMIIF